MRLHWVLERADSNDRFLGIISKVDKKSVNDFMRVVFILF